MLKLKSKLTRIPSQVWYKVLPIQKAEVESLIEDGNKRIMCEIKGLPEFNAALLPDGNGDFFILVNETRCKKLGLILGEVIEFSIRKDESELGMPMSEEFREVMDQFDKAKGVFETLTPGKKRSLVYWSDNVKSSEIKVRRAIVLCEHLEKNENNLDFKLLNQEMKRANQQAKLARE